MPLPVAHALLGASFVAAVRAGPASARAWLPLAAGALLALAADFDFLLVFLFKDPQWHRGFSHSIAGAVVFTAATLFIFGRRRWRDGLAYGLAYASHFALDYLTTLIGDGVELFYPFSRERYGARVWSLSEMPSQMTAGQIAQTLLVELLLFAGIFLFVLIVRRKAPPAD